LTEKVGKARPRAAASSSARHFDQDLRIGLRLLEGSDPVEGIRSAILDRAHQPHWRPVSIAEARGADVERCFAGLGAAELSARARVREPVASVSTVDPT
jgi:enoyl-CoA hydratase/isomerase-like protein